MIVGHVSGFEVLAGVAAIAGLLQHTNICIAKALMSQMKRKRTADKS